MAEEPQEQTNEQSEKRKKLRFKKTETSRLKTAAGQDKQPAEEIAVPPPQGAPGDGGDDKITDPMALRDTHTSKVRRVQASGEAGPGATAVPPGTVGESKKTETVHLKVVQQKKKEIADMMSPSSTVRLRAPGAKKGAKSVSRPGPENETIKVPPPTPVPEEDDEAKPASQTPPPSSTVSAEPPSEKKTSTQALQKVKTPPKSEDAAATTVVPRPSESAEAEAEGKDDSSKQTLKLRGTGKPGKTLKVPASKPGTPRFKRGKGGEETQEVPVPQGAPAGLTPGAPAAEATATRAEPGILFTLGVLVSTAAMAAAVYFMAMQLMAHIL